MPASFLTSVSLNDLRLVTVPKRSVCEESRVLAAAPKSVIVELISAPLPSRFLAAVVSSCDSAPAELAPCGPSAVVISCSEAYIWSSSTGVAVRSTGIVVPDAMVAAPRLAGESWM